MAVDGQDDWRSMNFGQYVERKPGGVAVDCISNVSLHILHLAAFYHVSSPLILTPLSAQSNKPTSASQFPEKGSLTDLTQSRVRAPGQRNSLQAKTQQT